MASSFSRPLNLTLKKTHRTKPMFFGKREEHQQHATNAPLLA
jgi:hypothetical protein